MTNPDHQAFEDEVIRVARRLFGGSETQGATNVGGRERDGVFWNGDFITVVEATTGKSNLKAENDLKKTHDLVRKCRTAGNMAKGYVVTEQEPTADQRDAAKQYARFNTVWLISFSSLRGKLFDTVEYIQCRSNRPFGSVYDHFEKGYEIPRNDYVEPTISTIDSQINISVDELSRNIKQGQRYIVTSGYGLGKSMLLRELFFKLKDDSRTGSYFRTPVAINLRQHNSQDYPEEILERHARNIGVDPQGLVKAWGAGYVDLLIDGFDEISTRGWTGDIRKLREYRKRVHQGVRALIDGTPQRCGVILVGRDGYFDSRSELRSALGLKSDSFCELELQPFDEAQAELFLKKKGLSSALPDWLPSRPLLLTYLASSRILEKITEQQADGDIQRGATWLNLMEMIFSREAGQSEGVDAETMKRFLGGLAVRARQTPLGQKSFSQTEIESVFLAITGNSILEEDRNLLLRLPGLGVASDQEGNRSFIDEDFQNACAGIALSDYVRSPYGDGFLQSEHEDVSEPVSDLGLLVSNADLKVRKTDAGVVRAALEYAMQVEKNQVAFDIAVLICRGGGSKPSLTLQGIQVNHIDLSNEEFDGAQFTFVDSIISRLTLPQPDEFYSNVVFRGCLIGYLEGRLNEFDLSQDQFVSCDVDDFGGFFETADHILDTELPLGLRVLIVSLRKIYLQSGSGRLESALLRGLDHRSRMIAPKLSISL
ncbi:hypothetical protein [uncultured Jannaschia sp.]|uniref:NACHT domain-containing protein n=1 Tax=uncultured Jannaschia sp. TaxID=293347 RepID=UPI00260E32ED|nr:hypothetical protein [uncultured Jannaschia sp.]